MNLVDESWMTITLIENDADYIILVLFKILQTSVLIRITKFKVS